MGTSQSRPCRRLALCAAVGAALLAPAALAQQYTVQVNPTLNNLDIRITPVANELMLVVQLKNESDKEVRCDFIYDAQPQSPHRTSTFIDPGKEAQSVFRAARKWFSVVVNVTCVAVQK